MSKAADMKLLDDAVLLERARTSGRSNMEETALALEAGEMPARYQRNADSLSPADQARLARSTVLLAGCGGLGGHVLENLARIGVGRIIVCDQGSFETSDCNRQPLAEPETLGRPKAQVGSERISRINPLIEVQAVVDAVGPELLEEAQAVADCAGGPRRRAVMQQLATQAACPMVSAGISGFSALVCSTWPGEAGLGEFMSGRMLSSDDVQGVLAPTVAFAASMQSAELVRILIAGSSALRGKLLVADIAAMRFNLVSLSTMA